MGFTVIMRYPSLSHHIGRVVSMGSLKEMPPVTTLPEVAVMTNEKRCRVLAVMEKIGYAMREVYIALCLKISISEFCAFLPRPTFCGSAFFDVPQKALNVFCGKRRQWSRLVVWHSISLLDWVLVAAGVRALVATPSYHREAA